MESSIDWRIHRKLDQARTVYLTMPRCSGKTWRMLELYEELIAAGKRVVFVKPEQILKGECYGTNPR